jgi:hypothetical protein
MIVNHPQDRGFAEVEQLGAVIMQPDAGRYHVGVLYKLDDGIPRICHLAWHHILCPAEDPAQREWVWLQCALDEINRKVARSAFAGIDANKKLPIPYSTIYEGIYFDPVTFAYCRTSPGDGLTCATFITEIFARLGFPLLRIETWRARESDAPFLEWVHGQLARLASAEHVRIQRERAGDPRFRPEEVAAAVASIDIPLDFDTAVGLGEKVIASFHAGPSPA